MATLHLIERTQECKRGGVWRRAAEVPPRRHSRLRVVAYTSAPTNLKDATGDEMLFALINCQYPVVVKEELLSITV